MSVAVKFPSSSSGSPDVDTVINIQGVGGRLMRLHTCPCMSVRDCAHVCHTFIHVPLDQTCMDVKYVCV